MSLKKTYTGNTSDTFDHNGGAGVIAVAYANGTGTITLSHPVGGVDVTIDSFTAAGGARFFSPMGTLKVAASSTGGSPSIHVEVQPLSSIG